ncbi:MAG TPA: hypothetical protein VKP65_22050, partial [Rhodothermales bacterium]|nr:hypothetical protein [Rhodothermales bacterium]
KIMMKKNWIILFAIAAILVVGAVFFTDKPVEEDAVLVVQPQQGPFEVTVTATGELQAKNSVKIYGPSGARRAQIYEMKILQLIPEGTVVEKGDFVAELDQSELNSKIQTAQIDFQKAESQYTQTALDTALTLSKARDDLINLRYSMEEAQLKKEQAAYEPPTVQRQEEINYEKARRAHEQATNNYITQVNQAIAQMKEVEAELSKARNAYNDFLSLASEFKISAPDKGMLIYRRDWRGGKTTVGGTVSSWDPVVATLPDLSIMESITYVNEVDIQKVKAGQSVEIGLDADSDRKLTGMVSEVANIGEQRPNSDAKVFQVSIIVNESDSTLRPAMTTSNTIVVAELPEVLHVPLETIHTQDSLTFVYTRRGGRTMRQEINLGLMNENEAIVEAGLEEDDRLYLSLPADTSGLPWQRLEQPETLAATPPSKE